MGTQKVKKMKLKFADQDGGNHGYNRRIPTKAKSLERRQERRGSAKRQYAEEL